MKHEKQGFYLDASIKNKTIINTLLQYIGGGVKKEEETKPEDVEEEQKGAKALRVQKAISYHPIPHTNSSCHGRAPQSKLLPK